MLIFNHFHTWIGLVKVVILASTIFDDLRKNRMTVQSKKDVSRAILVSNQEKQLFQVLRFIFGLELQKNIFSSFQKENTKNA